MTCTTKKIASLIFLYLYEATKMYHLLTIDNNYCNHCPFSQSLKNIKFQCH